MNTPASFFHCSNNWRIENNSITCLWRGESIYSTFMSFPFLARVVYWWYQPIYRPYRKFQSYRLKLLEFCTLSSFLWRFAIIFDYSDHNLESALQEKTTFYYEVEKRNVRLRIRKIISDADYPIPHFIPYHLNLWKTEGFAPNREIPLCYYCQDAAEFFHPMGHLSTNEDYDSFYR